MSVNYETLKISDWDHSDDETDADLTVFNDIQQEKTSADSAEINELFDNM